MENKFKNNSIRNLDKKYLYDENEENKINIEKSLGLEENNEKKVLKKHFKNESTDFTNKFNISSLDVARDKVK